MQAERLSVRKMTKLVGASCAGSSLMPQKKNPDALELNVGTKAHPNPYPL